MPPLTSHPGGVPVTWWWVWGRFPIAALFFILGGVCVIPPLYLSGGVSHCAPPQLGILGGTAALAYQLEFTDTFPVHDGGFFCRDPAYGRPYPGPPAASRAPPALVYSLVTAVPVVTVSGGGDSGGLWRGGGVGRGGKKGVLGGLGGVKMVGGGRGGGLGGFKEAGEGKGGLLG